MIVVPSTVPALSKHVPWNKGKIVGAKPPLRPKHVWSIRTKLQVEGRMRDLALFNVAIDSKLRGRDVVALKVDDLAPGGYSADRATVRQRKTGRPVKSDLTESTRQAIDDYLRIQTPSGREFVRLLAVQELAPAAEHGDDRDALNWGVVFLRDIQILVALSDVDVNDVIVLIN